jgi:flagellar protein FliS
MQVAQFAKSYKSIAVNTAHPGQLVLMLFDGALRFMDTAVAGFAEENISRRFEAIHNNLIKTQNILRELQKALNLNAGGEFAGRMFALYDFMIVQLTQANLKKDKEPIHVVEKLLGQIRDAWAQMLKQSSSEAA